MKRNSQLSGMLHVLLHLAEHDEPVTSDALAKAMRTNPVVIRRIMAPLRDRGYVSSEKGHGGGWTLAHEPSRITMRDVYSALGRAPLFALENRTEAPGCRVERAVNAALTRAFDEAETLLLERFGEVTLAMLSTDVRSRLPARGTCSHLENRHAI